MFCITVLSCVRWRWPVKLRLWELNFFMNGIQLISLIQNTLRYSCYDFTGYLHKMPRVYKWTCLRGSEWTPFVDAFFMQQRAETWLLNSNEQRFIIIVFSSFFYMTVRVKVIDIIVVCPALFVCWRDKITIVAFYNEALLLQLNSTKCISYKINNSKPIYTTYKEAKMMWNNLYPNWLKKIILFHSTCNNLSLFLKI